jgi:quinol monooxygenase YgiN
MTHPDAVVVVVSYQAQPGRAEAARRELGELIATVVQREPDCRGIRLLVDGADPHRMLLVEEWTSEAAYTGPHMQTPHLQAFIGRAGAFLAGPPDIRILRDASRS